MTASVSGPPHDARFLPLRSLLFTVLLPGLVTILVPYYVVEPAASRSTRAATGLFLWAGVVAIVGGALMLARCVWEFAARGRGTLAPIDPPRRLVVSGLYRHVRNPMYAGVLMVLAGEALVLASARLALYALAMSVVFSLFVLIYEEPALRRRFGAQYAAYAASVPRALPRLEWLSRSTGAFAAALALGGLLRVVALPLPGTLDVTVWKIWSYNGATTGATSLYGVGGSPPERRMLEYNGRYTTVDYPPLALYLLTSVGWMYGAWRPDFANGPAFTVAVKVPVVIADALIAAVLYIGVARRARQRSLARWAAMAWWLNPAVLLDGAVLGYLDPLFMLPALAAFVCVDRQRWGLAGAALAVAVLIKVQAVLVAPVLAIGLWRGGGRRALGRAVLCGAVVTAVVVAPVVVRGAGPNMWQALAALTRHDMLSGYAANLWWIATYLNRAYYLVQDLGFPQAYLVPVQRILAISTWIEIGLPNPRPIALALLLPVVGWALWRGRMARSLAALGALGALVVTAYFLLSVQVHENHLALAVPLLAAPAALVPRLRPLFWALSVSFALNLNLFYGIGHNVGYGIPRDLTPIDLSVLLSIANLGMLCCFARRLATTLDERGEEIR